MALRVGVIGCGNLGSSIIKSVLAGQAGDVAIKAVVDIPAATPRLQELARQLGCPWGTDILNMDLADVDLVVEAANQDVVKRNLIPVLERGKSVMVMSVGALADGAFLREVYSTARARGRRVYLPSGAVGGLDAIRSAALARLDTVILTTRKPPVALKGAPYITESGLDLDSLTVDTEIFVGNAIAAATAFPANLNVAVMVSLAGLGPERTQVRIVACPGQQCNIHEIEATGAFGTMRLQFENVPSPDNPKTSYLAALSAISTLRSIDTPVTGLT